MKFTFVGDTSDPTLTQLASGLRQVFTQHGHEYVDDPEDPGLRLFRPAGFQGNQNLHDHRWVPLVADIERPGGHVWHIEVVRHHPDARHGDRGPRAFAKPSERW